VPSGEDPAGGETAEPAAVTMLCRVVAADGGDGSQLLLAKADGGSGDVYALNAAGLLQSGGRAVDLTEPGAYQSLPNETLEGAWVEIAFSGDIMESYPAQLGGVVTVTVLPDGFDDRCRLYLDVLNDLWEVDSGLNSDGMTYAGVDLSQTSLSGSEQAAVAWAFAQEHGTELVQGTYEELAEQGYFTAEPLEGSDAKFWHWADGCLFSIREKPMEGAYSLVPVTFDAQKWRSGTGAYYFVDCTALQSANGVWSGYTVGSQAIS
jgi:hypothetical protein